MKVFFLLIFWFLWFLNFSSRAIISPLLPVIEDEFTLSHAKAGSLFSFVSAGYTTALFLAGSLSPRIGYKRTITVGFVIVITGLFSLRYTTSYLSMAASLLFLGIGAGIYMPSVIPLITSTFRRENWGKVLSIHSMAAPFGFFCVPILTAFALRIIDWKTIFPILGGACLTAITFFWLFAVDPSPQDDRRVGLLSVIRRREFWIITVLWAFAVASAFGIYGVIPLFLVKERNLSMDLANTVFGISRIGGFCVPVLAGLLVDRFGVKRILFLVFIVTGLSTIGLALAKTFPLVVTMLLLQGAAYSSFFPIGQVVISRLTSLRERSAFIGGTMATAGIFGVGLTPLILGAVADAWNFQSGILVLGILTCLSCLSLAFLQIETEG